MGVEAVLQVGWQQAALPSQLGLVANQLQEGISRLIRRPQTLAADHGDVMLANGAPGAEDGAPPARALPTSERVGVGVTFHASATTQGVRESSWGRRAPLMESGRTEPGGVAEGQRLTVGRGEPVAPCCRGPDQGHYRLGRRGPLRSTPGTGRRRS
jgi:hypothetical protein